MAVFTGLLAFAGGLQFWVMRGQLSEMKATRESGDRATADQLKVFQTQAAAMQTQATAMQGQLEQMQAQVAQTERAIAASNRLGEEFARATVESRRLADAAIAANSATKQLATAAVQANQINKQSLAGVQRAFVEVRDTYLDPDTTTSGYNGSWIFHIDIENIGNTPTVGLVVRSRCANAGAGFNDPYTIPSPAEGVVQGIDIVDARHGYAAKMPLGPKQIKTVASCYVAPDFDAIKLKKWKFSFYYLFGSAAYKDTFDSTQVHLTEFCFTLYYDTVPETIQKFLPERTASYWKSQLRPCGVHNCIDGDCGKEDLEQAARDLAPVKPPPEKRR